MPKPTPEPSIVEAVAIAGAREGLFAALEGIYADLDRTLGERPCKACGACCDFAAFGHRLYVSTAELAFLLTESDQTHGEARVDSCPWLCETLCSARRTRALGCRIFNCSTDAETESRLYEHFHRRIVELHSSLDIPYRYAYLPIASAACLGL